MEERLRRLTVDGVVYGWRVTHRHLPAPSEALNRVCVDQFMAFRRGTSRAPLRILFTAGPGGGPEYIQEQGVVRVSASAIVINLHRPKTAAALIRRASELGWPADAPLLVEDGFAFAAALPAFTRDQIAEPRSAPAVEV